MRLAGGVSTDGLPLCGVLPAGAQPAQPLSTTSPPLSTPPSGEGFSAAGCDPWGSALCRGAGWALSAAWLLPTGSLLAAPLVAMAPNAF